MDEVSWTLSDSDIEWFSSYINKDSFNFKLDFIFSLY